MTKLLLPLPAPPKQTPAPIYDGMGHFIRPDFHELEEASVRLWRGDLFEALIHIERAIPALSGLHDAVRKLQR
ncbi:hypothetical protein FZC33_11430 [Labrys sp. KNU-23]|uniref:hypothetical protein n=1 Tax=Labrys sp. KNU-23 TaxID=2789216 RepID=UPI0011F0808D|nr:hypothetical protein [Labrys sp. KNU-23]QEN86902.1 hypothetical protein FZC33_11430 [Labrys sp. KNU-23]